MLKINLPDSEYFDSSTNEFFQKKGGLLVLEHSLISVSKWESKWNKPFLVNDEKSLEESLDYVKCMTINDVNEDIYEQIDKAVMNRIVSYINETMTATTFSKKKRGGSREIVTSEIIYYWMFTLGIPKDCEKWHLSRLLTLIRVCSEKNAPKKKMSSKEAYEQQRMINEANRKRFNTKG